MTLDQAIAFHKNFRCKCSMRKPQKEQYREYVFFFMKYLRTNLNPSTCSCGQNKARIAAMMKARGEEII